MADYCPQFDCVWLACHDVDELSVADFITSFLEQSLGLAQILTHDLEIGADRIGIGGGEHFWRNLLAQRFQNLQLFTLWQTCSGEIGALE